MLNLKLLLLLFFVSSLKITILQANNLILSKEVSQNSEDEELPIFDERFDRKPTECYDFPPPSDCASATRCVKRSGIYKIQVGSQWASEPQLVVCDAATENGDWLVIQRRQDGSEDFYRTWDDYENGFGEIDGEFFIGLKTLHALTNNNGRQELMIILEDNNGTEVYAKFDSFAIADASESYKLKRVGRYSGTAGNSLSSHVNMKFSTKDRDNDLEPKYSCAVRFTGAWWYTNCHTSNLNGKYGDNTFGRGITWFTFRGHSVSLPYVRMMIRRSRGI